MVSRIFRSWKNRRFFKRNMKVIRGYYLWEKNDKRNNMINYDWILIDI